MFSVTKKRNLASAGCFILIFFISKLQQWEGFFFFSFRYSRSCLTLNILTFIWFPPDSYPRKHDLTTKVLLSHRCEIVNSCITSKCGIVFCQRTIENMKSCISLNLHPLQGLAVFPPYCISACIYTMSFFTCFPVWADVCCALVCLMQTYARL